MDEGQLADALDRFMSSRSLRDVRDVLREQPNLLGNDTLALLEEILRRLRHHNDTEHIASIKHWLGLLSVFRRFGVEEGYWEILADWLVYADHAATARLLEQYPELSSDTAREYYDRREREAHNAADQTAATKYLMASLVPGVQRAPESLAVDTTFVSGFLARFVEQDDDEIRHRYLIDHPEVLDMPAALIAEGLFQPSMNQAWSDVDVVELRRLYLRRAMFRRAMTAGARQAILEFEEGNEWPDLITFTSTPQG